MTPESLALAVLIILFAFFIRGITGFGSGLIAVPLLAHLLPLQFVVPLVLVLDFSAALLLLNGRNAPRANWRELWPVLPFSVIGVLVGTRLLLHLPKEPLLIGLGVFVIVFGLRNLFNIHGEKQISRGWAIPAGLTGGAVGALFGTGGPPYVIYFSHRLRDKAELRATFSGLFVIEGSLRLASFTTVGLLSQDHLLTALLLALPVMGIGLYLGNHAHFRISQAHMLRLVGLLLLGSGGSLIWRALA